MTDPFQSALSNAMKTQVPQMKSGWNATILIVKLALQKWGTWLTLFVHAACAYLYFIRRDKDAVFLVLLIYPYLVYITQSFFIAAQHNLLAGVEAKSDSRWKAIQIAGDKLDSELRKYGIDIDWTIPETSGPAISGP